MNAQKKLNVVLVVLVIILISIVSFVGVYHLDKNQMTSMLPNYALGTNISGYRKVTLEVHEDEEENTGSEVVTLGEDNEEEENAVEEPEQEAEETQEEKTEKYKKSADVIKNRLKSLKVEDFNFSCDESTGKIELTLPENDQTDIILSDITQVGKFEIADTQTGEVLLTNEDVKSVDVELAESYGYSIVYMDINFKLASANKFKDITKEYNSNAVVEVEVNEVGENTVEDTAEDGNNAANETQEESEEKTTEEVAKTVDLKIDDSTLLSTGFSEVVDNGVLRLTIGSSTDEEEIKNSLYGGYNVASIIENNPLEKEYEVTGNVYVQATIEAADINIVIGVLVLIAAIISVVMIVKYKMRGLLYTILSVGYVAILLLVVRYANVTLSMEGILAIGLSFIANSVFNFILLNNLKSKNLSKDERILRYFETMKKYSLIVIPLLVVAIVCCLVNWDAVYSFGMVMFWGIAVSLIYNLILPNLLVRNK